VTESPHAANHELDAPPWRRVESTLMATSRKLRVAYDAHLAPTGLNQTEASVVALLAEQGPLTQTDVAQRIGMQRAAAGAIVDKLEASHLVARRADPADRRVWLITLSPAGRRMAARVQRIDEQLRERLREGITHRERQQLARTLEKIRRNTAKVIASADSDGRGAR
jgi:DNA-binding MarR family transcriptional regulator